MTPTLSDTHYTRRSQTGTTLPDERPEQTQLVRLHRRRSCQRHTQEIPEPLFNSKNYLLINNNIIMINIIESNSVNKRLSKEKNRPCCAVFNLFVIIRSFPLKVNRLHPNNSVSIHIIYTREKEYQSI